MKIVKTWIILLILSICAPFVYGDYGIISFSEEVSPDLKIGKENTLFLEGILEKGGKITVRPFPSQPPISYQTAESPEVTIEPVGEDTIKQQLQGLSEQEKLDGVIFGHIMQDLVEDAVYVIVRIYLVNSEQYETFGDEKGIKVQEVMKRPGVIREHLEQIGDQVKQWLGKLEQAPIQQLPPQPVEPSPQPSKQQGEQEKPIMIETQTADILAQLGGSNLKVSSKTSSESSKSSDMSDFVNVEELPTQQQSNVQKPSGGKSQQKITIKSLQQDIKSLEDIYEMLYEQEHYVYTYQNDRQVLLNIAVKKYIALPTLINDLIHHGRQSPHLYRSDSCWMQGFISVPHRNWKGKTYKLCFDPSYMEEKAWQCPEIGNAKSVGKMKKRTYQQAKQELTDLNTRGTYTDWRMPTIDELFAMMSFLPLSSVDGEFLTFWSMTTNRSPRDIIWGLLMKTFHVTKRGRNIKIEYHPYVVSLLNTDEAFLVPVRDCPELPKFSS